MRKLSHKLEKSSPRRRKVNESRNIQIDVIAHPEDMDYTDMEYDESVQELIRKNVHESGLWGWCMVEVKATHSSGITNSAYIGGCSYLSEQDFIRNSPYFSDLKKEAIGGVEETINGIKTEKR